MGRRAQHWLQIAVDSGLPGLVLIVGACCLVTLATAHTIDSDEALQIVLVTFLGSMVGAYRVWTTNRKQKACNGRQPPDRKTR